MKTKTARDLYAYGELRDPWHAGDVFSVEMLGWAKRNMRGNRRILDDRYKGYNTEFTGVFQIGRGKDSWQLDYDNPQNPWKVRRIRDYVRFANDDLGIGKFCWSGKQICWFTLKRCHDDGRSNGSI